jgi:hypothetical protein
LSIYDKQKKELKENINPEIVNDFDGGTAIKLSDERQNEDSFCVMLQPFKMKETLTSAHFAKAEAKYPEKKAALKSLVNRLEEDDNPVLMIIKLK